MKLIAGETITFETGQGRVTAKIEDGSKGDEFSAKVLESDDEAYSADGVYTFDRALVAD